MKIKTVILAIVLGLSIAAAPILYFTIGPSMGQTFTPLQLETLKLLVIICAASAVYCFVVGELANNNSQMDKLWSILPPVYLWVIVVKDYVAMGLLSPRLLVAAILVTLWGIRLTFNFARKGAYSLKFWSGEEDYRWKFLKSKKEFKPHWKWMIFNLLFISIYQNVLVLLTTFPALIAVGKGSTFTAFDIVGAALALLFLIIETVADEQQWRFQSKKWKLINSGIKLEDLPEPYNRGFNISGLWAYTRHPNYLGEQGFWCSIFFFSIGALSAFNWTFVGGLLLIVLFLGSSTFQENISKDKYPEYSIYCKKVSRYIPWKKYS